ncbi:MAG: hypothetical protein KAU28_02450, partial [Phycisphaerae bacterium]|nr:hypothetical protein [Phycisphaerae bacterium]
LNYQFGFEVSKTWFYKLLSKAFVPLIFFAVVLMFAMSSIVLVREGEQYVVTHFGQVSADPLGPGLHFKWPWPIDTARRFRVGEVHEILLGVGRRREPTVIKGRELYLWTEEHGRREERDFLIAVPPRQAALEQRRDEAPPPVSVIKLVVAVHYTIRDVYRFGYGYTDAHRVLESVAYREMTRYCASATLDEPIPGDSAGRPEAIMSYGRARAAAELRRRIQEVADRLKLGVDISYVGILAAHPPSRAAPAFEEVLKAERTRDVRRYEAEAYANKILAQVAGTPADALELAFAIRRLEELEYLSRASKAELGDLLGEYIRQANDDIETLEEEIHRETLLGMGLGGRETGKGELRAKIARHIELLELIDKAPAGFDYAEAIHKAAAEAKTKFDKAVGAPARLVARAEAHRWKTELAEQGRAETFDREVLAYKASPTMYTLDKLLGVWDEVLPNITKYVIAIDPDKVEHWLNWERQADMMSGATFGKQDAQRGKK